MKKIIIGALLVLITACSDNGITAVEQLKEDYPHVKEAVEELPDRVQENLAVPKELPFQPKNVEFLYAGDPPGDPDGDILHTEFMYRKADGTIFQVTTFHNENASFHDEGKPKTTKLKDGTKVTIEADTSTKKGIRWKKGDHYYALMTMGTQLTIDDLVEAADSMEY